MGIRIRIWFLWGVLLFSWSAVELALLCFCLTILLLFLLCVCSFYIGTLRSPIAAGGALTTCVARARVVQLACAERDHPLL